MSDGTYYAVIFTSERTDADEAGYAEMSDRMIELAAAQPGYLGVDTARDPATGLGITISYWQSLEAIRGWKAEAEHRLAQGLGRKRWYRRYRLRIARVEDDRTWERGGDGHSD